MKEFILQTSVTFAYVSLLEAVTKAKSNLTILSIIPSAKTVKRKIESILGESVTFINTANEYHIMAGEINDVHLAEKLIITESELSRLNSVDYILEKAAEHIHELLVSVKNTNPWPPLPEELKQVTYVFLVM